MKQQEHSYYFLLSPRGFCVLPFSFRCLEHGHFFSCRFIWLELRLMSRAQKVCWHREGPGRPVHSRRNEQRDWFKALPLANVALVYCLKWEHWLFSLLMFTAFMFSLQIVDDGNTWRLAHLNEDFCILFAPGLYTQTRLKWILHYFSVSRNSNIEFSWVSSISHELG
jgi:hypothetical protein